MELNLQEFSYLHELIDLKFQAEYQTLYKRASDKNILSKYYGYSNYDPEKGKMKNHHSIKKSMIEDENVKKILKENINKINGQRLEKYKNKANKNGTVTIRQFYTELYCIYVGRTELELRNQAIKFTADTPIVKRLKGYNNSLFFIGSYFSVVSFKIQHFTLVLFNHTMNEGNDKFSAVEWGLHNHQNLEIRDEIYSGEAYRTSNYLYFDIYSERTMRRLSFEGFVDNGYPNVGRDNIILGFAHGISIKTKEIVNIECLLQPVPKNKCIKFEQTGRDLIKSKILNKNKFFHLCLYLATHRYTHRIKSNSLIGLKKLTTRGNEVKKYTHLKGVYRIWNFGLGERDRIIQSKFKINGDGTAYLYPYVEIGRIKTKLQNLYEQLNTKNIKEVERVLFQEKIEDLEQEIEFRQKFKEQPCVLTISKSASDKPILLVESFVNEDLSISNTLLLEIPDKKNNQIILGYFSTVGYNQKYGFTGGEVVLKKEAKNNKFEPMSFTFEEAKSYVNKYKLGDLWRSLYHAAQSSQWKPAKDEKATFRRLRQVFKK